MTALTHAAFAIVLLNLLVCAVVAEFGQENEAFGERPNPMDFELTPALFLYSVCDICLFASLCFAPFCVAVYLPLTIFGWNFTNLPMVPLGLLVTALFSRKQLSSPLGFKYWRGFARTLEKFA
jgi:hypothetical protein